MPAKKGIKFTKAHKEALSKAAKAKYAKKRGVKPGTKRGKYKRSKPMTLDQYADKILKPLADKFNVDNPWKVSENSKGDKIATYTPSPILILCGQLEDAILLLENRISNSIAKINSLM